MRNVNVDVAIIGAGGTGLRAAIAIAQENPELKIALISKLYPMRSHTCAAEGGAAAVVQEHDSLEYHFNDTVGGGDWLCDQDVVDYFVGHSTEEMYQLERWGCPWTRRDDGTPNVRAFGGMKIERTWFAADKTGFHMLHTLFQTSLQFPSIVRYDEYYCTDLIVEDGKCKGVSAIEIENGEPVAFTAKSVIMATGGAGRVFRFNTNAGTVTGDGMNMAYRAGAALRDMEFVQYHPTGLPGNGILMTEGCRGEGGILTNKDGYRYLQDYGLGPETKLGEAKNKYMELGPRDKLSQAFWHEQQKGRTVKTDMGDVVYLDLRHLGAEYIIERLPLIRSLSMTFVGVDPAIDPIPVRPAVHYTMGGIKTNIETATTIPGLFAAGECASVGLHGANRLGSNSVAETVVFGKVAGLSAAKYAKTQADLNVEPLVAISKDHIGKIDAMRTSNGNETIAGIRNELASTMEKCAGIYRTKELMEEGNEKIAELRKRVKNIKVSDSSKVYNTELLTAFELNSLVETAQSMMTSASLRDESRGAHQRLEEEFNTRDDENFLKHTLAYYDGDNPPRIEYESVNITRSQPQVRLYGGAAKDAEAAAKKNEKKSEKEV